MVSYVERAGDEWEFVCRGFQEVPWQSCGGVGGGYRVGPWRLPAAVSPPWPLVTPEMQRVVVSVQPRFGLTTGPLVDDLMGLLRGAASPVWDVRFADLSPDGWQRVMLPMALSLPLELQAAAVEREGVLDGGAACVRAIHMAAERGVLWPLPSSAGGWLRVDSAGSVVAVVGGQDLNSWSTGFEFLTVSSMPPAPFRCQLNRQRQSRHREGPDRALVCIQRTPSARAMPPQT